MPNQRKKGLTGASAYVEDETYAAFKAVCEREGITMADALRDYITKYAAKLNQTKPKKKGSRKK